MMPTKRRVLIFLIVLAVMMTAKYVWGQDPNEVGWDPQFVCYREPSIGDYAVVAAIFGPIFGIISGLKMAWSRHQAAKVGKFYNGTLVTLGL